MKVQVLGKKQSVIREWMPCFIYLLKVINFTYGYENNAFLCLKDVSKTQCKTITEKEITTYHSNASYSSGSMSSKHPTCCVCNALPLTCPVERLPGDPLGACSSVSGTANVSLAVNALWQRRLVKKEGKERSGGVQMVV